MCVCTVAAALTWLQEPGAVCRERRRSRTDLGTVPSPLFLPASVPSDDIRAISHVVHRQPKAAEGKNELSTTQHDAVIGCCLRREGAEDPGSTYRCYPQQ